MSRTLVTYINSYKTMARQGVADISAWSIIHDMQRNMLPKVIDNPRDDQIARFVNDLRNTCVTYGDSQQLRERLRTDVNHFLTELMGGECIE